MTITNHLLAGSIIGLVVTNPALAMPIAFMSHFAMDALPHFGYAGRKGYSEVLQHRRSYIVGWFTVITSAIVIAFLAWNGLWLALIAGIIAAIPDAFGVYNWLAYEKHGKQATGWLRILHVEFHRRIQWCERPWGIYIEVVTTTLLGYALWALAL